MYISYQDWKPRYYAHGSSFRDPERRTETRLSEHVWSIQEQQLNYVINWKIIEKTSGFNPVTLQCKICLSEIYHIVNSSTFFLVKRVNLNEKLKEQIANIFRQLAFSKQWGNCGCVRGYVIGETKMKLKKIVNSVLS